MVESATEPFDMSGPIGRAMVGMLGVWSQLEADMCSERTSSALAARRARGHRLGARPLALEAPEVVRQVQELYRRGRDAEGRPFTHRSLADDLNLRGVRTKRGARWHATQVARTLRQEVPA